MSFWATFTLTRLTSVFSISWLGDFLEESVHWDIIFEKQQILQGTRWVSRGPQQPDISWDLNSKRGTLQDMCGQGHRTCLFMSTNCQLTRAQCLCREADVGAHWHSRKESVGQGILPSLPNVLIPSSKDLTKCVWDRATRIAGHFRKAVQFLHCLK